MSQTPPILSVRGLVHRYRDRTALALESLDIPKGVILGIRGPNGSGKSTLLRILAFLLAPSQGELFFHGRPALDAATLRRRITLLVQRPVLLKRSVFENVAYGLRVRGETAGLEKRVVEALQTVGLSFESFARRSWRELSGGEAQRVAMAARLAIRPEVLLLDEPTASLDEESAERITAAARAARDTHGATVVVVSHDLAWLSELCEHILRFTPDGSLAPLAPHKEECP